MPVINGVYTKDFPALGRAPIDTDIIPIAELANQITYKTTIGAIFNAKVFGTTGAIPKFTSTNTLGDSIITELSDKIGVDIATPNNKLSINSTDPGSGLDLQIGATSYARFGIINPGLPGEPGIDNDCFIGSTINNDFLVRTNNIEALRIDTAQRLTIANIQNALADTDKFLVSEGGVIKYRTGAEVLADIGAGVGSVTSVGLTMPVAFSVANSPITSSGTLEVTAIGTASQYIRGDGTLATIPSTSSGGANVNYYLNGSVAASVATYKQMANSAVIGAGTDFNLTGNGLIAQFLTDAGNPNRLLIPGGAWNFEMYFNISSSGGNSKFYVELLKYNGTTFTSIASSVSVPEEITGGTTTDLYITSLAVPETVLLITDRLALRVYIVDNSGGRTVTLHTEDNTLCLVTTTFAGGIAALNGLTANTQYFAVGTTGTDFNISSVLDTHTFNLPTASATNRGALSSANWSTFNGKIGGTGTTNYIPKFNGTSSLTNSTIFEDAGGVAIGTNFSVAPFLFYVNGGIGAAGNSTITGNLTASQFIVPGGTSSQFLKANGSLDSTAYATTSSLSAYVPYTGATGAVNLGAYDLTVNGINIGLGGGAISTNTRVGTNALSANTIGSFNTSIGRISLNENTTGGSNTAIGDFALGSNTTGGLNIAQGAGAGNSNTTGSNNIFLGYNSTGESATENNRTWIGNTSTTSTWLGGNLLLGSRNNATSDKLQITGGAKITGIITLGTGADSYVYDSGGSLILQTGASPRLTIDPSGNLGLGVTPSAWNLGKAQQIGTTTSFFNDGSGNTYLGNNFYYNSNFLYTTSANSVNYVQTSNGEHRWLTAPSGTAGNAISFTQAMTLTAGGNLGVGTATPSYLLTVGQAGTTADSYIQIASTSTGTGNLFFGDDTGGGTASYSGYIQYQHGVDSMVFGTSNTERMRITSGGNVLIGTTTDAGYKLDVNGTGRFSGALSSAAQIASSTFLSATRAGADGVGEGPYVVIAQGTDAKQWLMQLNGSQGLDYWHYNGSAWSTPFKIASTGAATFSSSVAVATRLAVGGGNGKGITIDANGSAVTLPTAGLNLQTGYNVSYIVAKNVDGNPAGLYIDSSLLNVSSLGTGTVTATSGTLSTVSDSAYKIDAGFIDSALDKVMNLKPRYFYWNDKSGLPMDVKQLGFYAQEVNSALGEESANTPATKNIPWGISDRSVIAMLTKAIQEQQAQIEELKALINKNETYNKTNNS